MPPYAVRRWRVDFDPSHLDDSRDLAIHSDVITEPVTARPPLIQLGFSTPTFCALTLVWLCGYAIAVAKAGDFLRRSRVRRALDGLMGAVLVALGVRLATAQR